MGFFSDLLKGVGSVVGAVINPVGTVAKLLGGGSTPTATALVQPGPAAQQVVQTAVTGTGVPLASGAGKSILTRVSPKATVSAIQFARGDILPRGGGNGKVAKRTIVQTINLDTGNVVNEIVLEGAPFLMNKAVRELARTTKKLRKANAKIPRRTVQASLAKQLTDRVMSETINHVGDHHGHNGNC